MALSSREGDPGKTRGLDVTVCVSSMALSGVKQAGRLVLGVKA